MTEYHYLDEPAVMYHVPTYLSHDPANKYFYFLTNERQVSSGDFVFLGTAVYYRIYSDESTMKRHISAISVLNTKNNGSVAANAMIGTYKYKELGVDFNKVPSPLIPNTGTNKRVYIRLTNIGEAVSVKTQFTSSMTDYKAKIMIAESTFYIPSRIGVNKSFDFGRAGNNAPYHTDNDAFLSSNDEDVEWGSPKNDKWYVNMYAVEVGRDGSWTQTYSTVLHLGNVMIDANNKDN